MIFYELTRWWAYRTIKGQGFSAYLWGVPLLITAPVALAGCLLRDQFAMVGTDGLFAVLSQTFTILPGFFVASLSAVAALNNEKMDEDMPAPCPTIVIKVDGTPITETLSRRMYLLYLFSYLFVVTIIVSLISAAFKFLVQPENVSSFVWNWPPAVVATAECLSIIATTFVVVSLFVTMLHGVYFMIEKNRQP